VDPDFQARAHKVIGSVRWIDPDGTPQRPIFLVLTIQEDMITDMQEFRTRVRADRFARRP
jgi:hypothetical protein